jgi:hypothetical protein
VDGDLDLDVVVTDGADDGVSVLLNLGDGTFGPSAGYPAGDAPSDIVAVDVDQDGDLDLAVTNRFGDDLSILLNLGDGTFAPPIAYATGDNPRGVAAADVVPDVAVASSGDHSVSILLNDCPDR